ncbi:unnamed protein product [Schistosoma margrebowiei]|uniref:Uncharacterized protein n=1 Tax=Schistosoma margrebowiei TaxID=48269 RepID=A0A183LYY9_9TREM|nr:unnamed protein product [Schistosoma margrebowiei]
MLRGPKMQQASSSSEECSPRGSQQLACIPQFTPDIRHTSGANNVVADPLSRITPLNSFQGIDLLKLVQFQKYADLRHELSSTTPKLRIKQMETEVLSCLEDILLIPTSSHLPSLTSDIPQTALEILPSVSLFSFSLLLRVSTVLIVPKKSITKTILS